MLLCVVGFGQLMLGFFCSCMLGPFLVMNFTIYPYFYSFFERLIQLFAHVDNTNITFSLASLIFIFSRLVDKLFALPKFVVKPKLTRLTAKLSLTLYSNAL